MEVKIKQVIRAAHGNVRKIDFSSVSYCRKCALCRYSPLTCRIYYRRQNHHKTKELGCFRQLLGNHVSWLTVMEKSRFPFVYGENLEDVLRTQKSLKNGGFKVFWTNFGKSIFSSESLSRKSILCRYNATNYRMEYGHRIHNARDDLSCSGKLS